MQKIAAMSRSRGLLAGTGPLYLWAQSSTTGALTGSSRVYDNAAFGVGINSYEDGTSQTQTNPTSTNGLFGFSSSPLARTTWYFSAEGFKTAEQKSVVECFGSSTDQCEAVGWGDGANTWLVRAR